MARYPKKSKAKKGKPKCTLNKKICRKYSKETLEVLIQPDATEKFGMPEQYFGMAIAYWQTERMNSYQLNSIPLEKGQSDLEIQIISFLKRTVALQRPPILGSAHVIKCFMGHAVDIDRYLVT
ncbi:unnamed protein product [Fusarium graminearum]|uniref:Uncharacterized protein n=1 Tax=Gibberella zeae TaxID=5518 RepID=A0A4E9DPG0_GIBZA|nr:unnamed protein product [Fusarium graminearum]CAG1994822.1 unnamed protein product [Fusarium graminearum]